MRFQAAGRVSFPNSRLILCSLMAAASLSAQPASETYRFDAASVKGLESCGRVRANNIVERDRITLPCTSLRDLVMRAYGAGVWQVIWPKWLEPGGRGQPNPYPNYQLQAVMPASTTKAQLQSMFRSLLTERFGFRSHTETRSVTVYQLSISPSGSKLHGAEDPHLPPGTEMIARDPHGWRLPLIAAGSPTSDRVGAYMLTHFVGLCIFLLNNEYPIVDKTGLDPDSWYDTPFFMPFAVGSDSRAGAPRPEPGDLIKAVEKQLGLRIQKTTAPFELIAIDHAERIPTEN
jgi:uncharacterized protein (TIGR03435 family)